MWRLETGNNCRMADEAGERPGVIPLQLPLTRERATEIVRDIAQDSKRWSILIDYKVSESWRGLVNRRQIGLCLKEGYVLENKADKDEHGYWRFKIARVCAGMNVVIDVALEAEGSRPHLRVLAIDGDRIEI